jgi:hypothetical protein
MVSIMTQSLFKDSSWFLREEFKDVNKVDTFLIQIDTAQDIAINGVCSVKLIYHKICENVWYV